jgi:hypothetical protein
MFRACPALVSIAVIQDDPHELPADSRKCTSTHDVILDYGQSLLHAAEPAGEIYCRLSSTTVL